jgi:Skp family chaperone for outer membrane proteins
MEFEKKITLVQREVQEKKQKLELAHRQAISKVHKAINNIVATFSKKNNISVVLYNTQTIFADKKLNISLEIISLLNQKLKFVQLNY